MGVTSYIISSSPSSSFSFPTNNSSFPESLFSFSISILLSKLLTISFSSSLNLGAGIKVLLGEGNKGEGFKSFKSVGFIKISCTTSSPSSEDDGEDKAGEVNIGSGESDIIAGGKGGGVIDLGFDEGEEGEKWG